MKKKKNFFERIFGLEDYDELDEFEDFDEEYYCPRRLRNENKIIVKTDEYVKENTKEKEITITLPQDMLDTFKGMSEKYRVSESKKLAEKEKILQSKDVKSVNEILRELDEIMLKFNDFKFSNSRDYENSIEKERDIDERSNE